MNGFNHINTHGDDRIYYNDKTNSSVKVTTPQKSTPIGTMLNIVRNSNIPKKKWLEFRKRGYK